MTGPHVDIVGGGPFRVRPGQVTDDTQMACCLAASLRLDGKLEPENVARRYTVWMESAFDVGGQTSLALLAVKRGASAGDAGRSAWVQSGRHAAGNGSLMRCAPIAVFFAQDAGARRSASLADSAITHYDPRCRLAGAAFNAAVADALRTSGRGTPGSMIAAAEAELDVAEAQLRSTSGEDAGAIADARDALREDLQAARRDDPELYGPELHLLEQQGFVRVAFRLAFWELTHAPSFEAALIDVVNRGGDADTNGAITGALLGAAHGDSGIPARWSRAVLGALQDAEPGPLRDHYHPRQLLQLIDG